GQLLLRKNYRVLFSARLLVQLQPVFESVRKAEVTAFGHLVRFQPRNGCRLFCQKRGRLILVAWSDDVEIPTPSKLKMELESLAGNQRRRAGNSLGFYRQGIWQHFQPIPAKVGGNSGSRAISTT